MISEIRELVTLNNREALAEALLHQITTGSNQRFTEGDSEHIATILSAAVYVRGLMESGITKNDAIRQLGRNMRLVQSIKTNAVDV